MMAYDWKGNVRELQSLIEQAIVFGGDTTLGPECFPQLTLLQSPSADLWAVSGSPATDSFAPLAVTEPPEDIDDVSGRPGDSGQPNAAWPTLLDIERSHITHTLHENFYNQSAAARLLGIDRKLLARKIKKYRIRMPLAHPGRPAGSRQK